MPDTSMIIGIKDRPLVESFLKDQVWSEVTVDQQNKYRTIERNDLFWKGFHYCFAKTNVDGSIQWSTPLAAQNGNGGYQAAYDYVLNYYRGDGKKLVGILGRTPNMIAEADDKTNEEQVARAATANILLNQLRWHWPLESMNAELVRMLWTDGLTFIYTPYYADGRKFGHTTLPLYTIERLEVQPGSYVCPQCQGMSPLEGPPFCTQCGGELGSADTIPPEFQDIAVPTGENQYPNGSVGASLHNSAEVIIAPKVKELADSPFLIFESEHYKGAILEKYPEIAADRQLYQLVDSGNPSSNSGNSYGRQVRSRVDSLYPGNTSSRKNYWTLSLIWLQPCVYEALIADTDTQRQELGRHLKELFPNGVKIPTVNGIPLKFEEESMLEVWQECKPEVGPSLDTQALGSEYPRANRLVDDVANIMMECAEKGLPMNFYDPQRIDPNTINAHASNPVDYIPVLPNAGGDMNNIIKSTSGVEMSPEPMKMLELFLSSTRDNAGITPALTGTDTSAQTLGEATMKRNMALMPHNVTWGFIRKAWEGGTTNGIIQLAKYNFDTVHFGGERNKPARSLKIDNLRELLKGGWHITADEQIPSTWGQEKAQIFQLLEMGPEVYEKVYGLSSPNNVQSLNTALGNNDVVVPGVNEYKMVLSIIKELLLGQPTQSMGPMGPQLLPSIQPDPFELDPSFAVMVVKEWVAVPDNFELKKTNPMGYANVIAWGKENQGLVPPPPGMEGQGGPGGPIGGGQPPAEGGQPLLATPPGGLSPESQPQLAAEESGALG